MRTRSVLFALALPALVADAGHITAGSRILDEPWPRAFFFRQSEAEASRTRFEYAPWEAKYSRLHGIIGKVLEEEVPGRSAALPAFTRLKATLPDQTVLIHINGNARLPDFAVDPFFAGHWLYYNGTRLLDDMPAQSGTTVVRVADVSLFSLEGGRFRSDPDDVGLCRLDAQGRPDWREAEQVQLVAIDAKSGTATFKRGCYGTAPRAWRAGETYAAAHAFEGPWGRQGTSHILWLYNYATTCPRDVAGRSASQIWAAQLAQWFAAKGPLAPFDGLEFDSTFYDPGHATAKRGADCDADGRRDDGVIGGVNVYGVGFVEFCRDLRRLLGPTRLILADGALDLDRSQRAFALLNGIESEGFPSLRDPAIDDWSGGLNRHNFWRENASAPAFSYINHKFIQRGRAPQAGVNYAPVPWSTHRLVFAAALLTNTAITSAQPLPESVGNQNAIWDEWVGGRAQQKGWLGFPVEPARQLALETPNLFPSLEENDERISRGNDATEMRLERGRIHLKARPGTSPALLSLRVRDLHPSGADLFVRCRVDGAPLPGHPAEIARLMHVCVVPAGHDAETGTVQRMAWVGRTATAALFTFDHVPAGPVDLIVTIEGGAEVSLDTVSVHAAAASATRAYDHGVVLANPARHSVILDLSALYPGQRFRRLQATAGQDSATNNGKEVSAPVTLGPKDALFLARQP